MRTDTEGSPSVAEEKSSAVLLFEAVAALRFSPDYPKGKGVIHKRVETVGVYPLVRPRGVSALPRRGARHVPAAAAANPPLRFSEKLSAR